jgi:hypothetical protein
LAWRLRDLPTGVLLSHAGIAAIFWHFVWLYGSISVVTAAALLAAYNTYYAKRGDCAEG